MFRFVYPAKLKADPDGGYVVAFPDLPEAITQGEDQADALREAADCLEEAIAGRIRRNEEIPAPSPVARGSHAVSLSALFSAKAALYLAMKTANISQAELAQWLGWNEQEVWRLLDPRHASKLSRIEAALAALGLKLVVEVRKAA